MFSTYDMAILMGCLGLLVLVLFIIATLFDKGDE